MPPRPKVIEIKVLFRSRRSLARSATKSYPIAAVPPDSSTAPAQLFSTANTLPNSQSSTAISEPPPRN